MTLAASNRRLLAAALFAVGVALCGAQTPSASEAKAAATTAAKEKAKASAPSLAELQKKIKDQRDTMIADHDAFVKQLKDATEAQKKEILEKMAAQKRSFEEANKTLHRQMQEELRRVREKAGPGKR